MSDIMKIYVMENKPEGISPDRIPRKVKVKANAFYVDNPGSRGNLSREMVFKVVYDLGDGWEIAMAVVGQSDQEGKEAFPWEDRFNSEKEQEGD